MCAVSAEAKAGIRWMDWGPAVFERAQREDKLILLDSGATWCHWCHVMDHVTYEDDEVIRTVHEHYIPVRIDRDRLSEVDAHFQRAVPIVNSQAGGWPLTVILTPDGQVLFKATFVPPRAAEGLGGAGLVELLGKIDEFWRANRDSLRQTGRDIAARVVEHESKAFTKPGKLSSEILAGLQAGLRGLFDSAHGGFGGAPKFFNAPAIEFLLAAAWRGDKPAMEMVTKTLQAIARGGVYDQVGGGFHRYSVDARWHVPHFEKMGYDNAAMLAHYANAFALTGDESFHEVCRGTTVWINATLLDGARRGFHASQDADVGPDDDGDYFTWTADEIRRALGGGRERTELALYYFDVDEEGDMHGQPGRNVLHEPKTLAQAARLLDRKEEDLRRQTSEIREALLRARQARPAPAVDKTIFADINGMTIDAYLTAWERLGDESLRDVAMEVLDRLMADLRDSRGVFAHYRGPRGLEGAGLLSDQAFMLRAMLHAFSAGGDAKYLEASATLAEYIRVNLVDANGSFLSAPQAAATGPADVPPTRGWEDGPWRNPGATAAETFLHLGRLLGRPEYVELAGRSLESFAGAVNRQWAVALGGYALAAEAYLNGPRRIVVTGPANDDLAATLLAAARAAYVPGGLVLRVDGADGRQKDLLESLGIGAPTATAAYVCGGKACLLPARSVGELRQRVCDLAGQ